MNPWQQNILELARNFIRFALWCAILLNGAMLTLFSIAFTFQFLFHLWGCLKRVMFDEPW